MCIRLTERNVDNELQDVGAPSGAARVLGLGAAKLSVAGTLGPSHFGESLGAVLQLSGGTPVDGIAP